MPSQLAPWEIYRKWVYFPAPRFLVALTQHRALAPLKYGDALWLVTVLHRCEFLESNIDRREPGPIYSYRRVQLGDVGYIRQGRFHLLFSAGIPLGSRELGIHVPHTFEQLDVGPIIRGEVRPPGPLSTSTVKQIGANVGGSSAVPWCVHLHSAPVCNRGTDLTFKCRGARCKVFL